METLVKFCLVGLIVGAWFSEYVIVPLHRKVQILDAYRVRVMHSLMQHPLLVFTLLMLVSILLIQERMDKNDGFIKQNPSIQVNNWSIIP